MKPKLVVLVALFTITFSSLLEAQITSDYRHWTTSSGRRSDIRLKLIDLKGRVAKLQREDNDKIVTMSLTTLSTADREFIDSLSSAPDTSKPSPNSMSSQDWSQWRGANRDGKSLETGLLTDWPSEGPRLIWNTTGVGEGYSTPSVSGNVIYVLGGSGSDEFLYALSADDGNQLWKTRIGGKSGGGGYPGPRGTPTVDGDMIYSIGSDGSLSCINRNGGELVWNKNLKNDFGGQHGHWDYAESPLIDGDKLICTPGGSRNTVVALRKNNGQPIWNSPVGSVTNEGYSKAGYASTIVATIGGTRQYVAFVNGGVVGVAADSGAPLWHYDSPANGTANCSTPVVFNDSVFAASAYGTGGGLARIKGRGRNWSVQEAYFEKKMENHHGGFVLHEGHIYGTNNSTLVCLEWNSGRIKWQDRCVGKGSTSYADGHLYVRGEGGDIALVEASPDGYREKGRFSQPDRSGKNAWPHPVISGGRLIIHDHGRMLCFAIR